MSKIDTKEKILISGVVLARNEAQLIGDCLNDLSFCDELIVIDMESSDNTVSIVASRGARVIFHTFIEEFDAARGVGVDAARGAYILVVDADERIPRSLSQVLVSIARDNVFDGVYIPRANKTLDGKKTLRNSFVWPDYNLRFFKKGKVCVPTHTHESWEPEIGSNVFYLPPHFKNAMIHWRPIAPDIFFEKMKKYAQKQALLMSKFGATRKGFLFPYYVATNLKGFSISFPKPSYFLVLKELILLSFDCIFRKRCWCSIEDFKFVFQRVLRERIILWYYYRQYYKRVH